MNELHCEEITQILCTSFDLKIVKLDPNHVSERPCQTVQLDFTHKMDYFDTEDEGRSSSEKPANYYLSTRRHILTSVTLRVLFYPAFLTNACTWAPSYVPDGTQSYQVVQLHTTAYILFHAIQSVLHLPTSCTLTINKIITYMNQNKFVISAVFHDVPFIISRSCIAAKQTFRRHT